MNPIIENLMRDIREKAKKNQRKPDATKPIALWSEKDILDGEIAEAMVAILNTAGCSWAKRSGCTMCGYINDTCEEVLEKDFLQQIERIKQRYEGQPYVKLFTSGSFTNPEEIPVSIGMDILSHFSEECRKICIESRVEYITEDWMNRLSKLPCEVEIALGLESANDRILSELINKNITFEDYMTAAQKILSAGLKVKTYLLLKPPFLTEREAVEDCVDSIGKIIPLTNTISINPVNVQKFTLVDHLHYRGHYRPPWYYSLAEVFTRCLPLAREKGVRLMSTPSGAGTPRGIHNCKNCDWKYAEAFKAISLLMAGLEVFERIECQCRTAWLCDMATQDAALDHYSTGRGA